jgi:hypothetical protein
MKTHGWQLVVGVAWLLALACKVTQLIEALRIFKGRWWETIRGKVEQFDAFIGVGDEHCDDLMNFIFKMFEADAREQMKKMGIDVHKLHCVGRKLLIAQYGYGHQPVHYDVTQKKEAETSYAAFLYCSATNHTSVPRQKRDYMAPAFMEKRKISTDERMMMEDILKPSNFVSDSVRVGDMMIMRMDTPHHGILNQSEEDRVVLYLHFSECARGGQGTVQRYPLGVCDTRRVVWNGKSYTLVI